MAAPECLTQWASGHSAPTLMVGASAGTPPVPALRSALTAFASESNFGEMKAGERNRTSNPRFTKALLYH